MKKYNIKTTDVELLKKWYYLMTLGRALDEKAPAYLLQSLGWSFHAPYAGHDGIQLAIGQVFTKGEDSRLVIMQKLESTAAECGVNLRTSGNLKDVQIANGVLGYELDINADAAPLRNVCQFIIALSLSQPRFFWDNLTLKPSGGNVTLVGKLKVVVVTGNGALRNYWGDDA